MQKHTLLYLRFFDYGEHSDTFIPCEYCGDRAVDINHIDARGMGGSKYKDVIENLMASCREHHIKAEHNLDFNKKMKIIHLEFIKEHRPDYEIQN